MKLREVAYVFGIKPKPRVYGSVERTADLGPPWGEVRYAAWLHPRTSGWQPTAAMANDCAKFIRPGDFCIDVGAHFGDSTLPMALAAGADGCVLAMEPNRYLAPVLEHNARLLADRARVDVVVAAATREAGTYTFGYVDPGFCNGGDTAKLGWLRRRAQLSLDVTGINLRELLLRDYADRLDRLRLIKVDTEGHDAEVLDTIADLIIRHRPYIQAEVFRHASPDARAEQYHMLRDWGYTVHLVTAESPTFGRPTTLSELQSERQADVFAFPPGVEAVAA